MSNHPPHAASESSASLPLRAVQWLKENPLQWMLLAVPLAVVLEVTHADPVWIFIISCAAVIPLAGLMGRATENLAETLGAGIGGLLNATFGNAAELIIALIALHKGPQFHSLVKASITGSIIGNILLVLGLAMLCGGLRFERQVFNKTAASVGATLLTLACVGLVMPTLFFEVMAHGNPHHAGIKSVETLSEEIAVVLMGVYVLSLVFSLKTHRHLFAGPEDQLPTTGEHHQPEWSRKTSLIVLLSSTVGVALMSEFLVGSVEAAGSVLGNQVFVGVIVVAIIGNAAEHSTAVLVAMKDKMDLSVNIAVGSSLQIALFVAPVLVFASMAMGHSPVLDLHFTLLELITMLAAILVLGQICQDGESHWMEGVMLLAVYGIIALAFYNLPAETATGGH
jgi:Ca2+:H+ antiporter